MPSRINIGPETGPFVELDEENGEFVIRVPEDEVNFDQSDLRNVKDFTADSVNTDRVHVKFNPDADDLQTVVDTAPEGALILSDGHTVYETTGVDVTTPGITLSNINVRAVDDIGRPMVRVLADDVTVTDCAFDGNKAGQPNSGSDRFTTPIYVSDSKGVVISKNSVIDSNRHGILVADADAADGFGVGPAVGASITDNTVHAPARDGVSVDGAFCTGISVVGNHIYNSDARGGVEIVDGANNCVAAHNHTEGSDYAVVSQDHGDQPPYQNLFIGNTGRDCTVLFEQQGSQRHKDIAVVGNTGETIYQEGIVIRNMIRGIITHNRLVGTGSTGIMFTDHEARDVTVAHNTLRDIGGTGIRVFGERISVSFNNVVVTDDHLVKIEGGKYIQCVGNGGGFTDDNGDGDGDGVHVLDCNNVVVTNMVLDAVSGAGVRVSGTSSRYIVGHNITHAGILDESGDADSIVNNNI